MSELSKLIGQDVVARIPGDKFEEETILRGKVIGVDINDFYFYEKNEPILIRVNLEPGKDEKVSDDDLEDYINIPLSYITLY